MVPVDTQAESEPLYDQPLIEMGFTGEDPSFENWEGFGGDDDVPLFGGDGEALSFGGLVMRQKNSLESDQASDERVLKSIRQSRGGPIVTNRFPFFSTHSLQLLGRLCTIPVCLEEVRFERG